MKEPAEPLTPLSKMWDERFDKLESIMKKTKTNHKQLKTNGMEKAKSIIYWVTTASVAFGMTFSGLAQIFHAKAMVDIITHVGYPLYFLYLIGVWKILGVITILIPGNKLLKEWAYAGLFFVMSGAVFSHLAIGDGLRETIGPLAQSVFIFLSWYFRPASRKLAII